MRSLATCFALALFVATGAACESSSGAGGTDALVVVEDAGVAPDRLDVATDDVTPQAPPDPSQPGPWGVGVVHVDWLDESRARTLPVEIWYPIPPGSTDGEDNAFELAAAGVVLGVMETGARRGAAPAEGGPWPLVLFSHGNGGTRYQSHFYCEHLASHGFVVASPDHVGNTLPDLDDGPEARASAAVARPLDMIFVLDRMLEDEDWSVDEDRVAITGHSFGGWTAVETSRADPRFAVVLPIAPGFIVGTPVEEAAAGVDRPLMIVGGGPDAITPFDEHSRPLYELVPSGPAYLARILPAGHYDFTDVCAVEAIRGLFSADSCTAEVMESGVVHGWTNTLATAFLRTHLLGETGHEAWLAPESYDDDETVEFWAK